MAAEPPESANQPNVRVIHLLPNLLTIAAVCAGLTAIRFGYERDFEMAVRLVLVACVLDGLDGRLARLMNRCSEVGAELDSLADFVNFGVAPVLIMHSWLFQDFRSAGWIAVLIYTTCCLLRLARFNVSSRSENDDPPSDFFVGIPSPAGAILVLLPMIVSFAISDLPLIPPVIGALHICLIGFLMISQTPTYSFKNVAIDRANAKFFLLGAAILTAALLTYLWATLTVLALAYIGCLIWAYLTSPNSRETKG
ncbi:CDP-diacylglycerol--serine O-phosphatidyltransferase [Loktanella sp. Alg231-35]|uniref:CDP-diacylglycerol--serine O-phosphatidyltransferase n=1 Tax=Loktanella sp. Alg231-35 TaxID=1922220 RepID=UPI000D560017|nr:CDP-diacylglycerol--serine O-phosphatidyltransferase [Loktanella sp. Alg231-35]